VLLATVVATLAITVFSGAARGAPTDPPRLSLSGRASAEPLVGATTRLGGTLEAYGRATGQRVVLEADRFPFDDVFEPVAETTTDDVGDFSFSARLTTNTRFRAVATGLPERPVSGVVPRIAHLGYLLGFRRLETAPSATAIMRGPRSALDGRRLYVYRFRYRRETGTRVGAITLHSTSERRASGRTRLRLARLPKGDGLVVCLREPRDDGIGRHSALQRRCGRSTLRAGGGDPGLGILLTSLR